MPAWGVEMPAVGGARVRQEPQPVHTPVLVRQVVAALCGSQGEAFEGCVVDGTVGAAGHALAILETFPGARVLGIDQDPAILLLAKEHLAPHGGRARLRRGRLSTLPDVLVSEEALAPRAMLYDLGVSSLQLDDPGRGFSLRADGPLDMRMDPTRERTAADIVNEWDEEDLADLFYYEGGERKSRRIAAAIVEARRRAPFHRTQPLVQLIERALGRTRAGRVHVATRTFQALRRAVNEEGEELRAGLIGAEACLPDGGLLLVISFHSGEDAVVKRFLAEGTRAGRWELTHKKPLVADEEERRANPRARSAKLRTALRRRRPLPGSSSTRPDRDDPRGARGAEGSGGRAR